MRTMVIFLLVLFAMIVTSGQTPSLSKEYYLQKSKSQKTTGWVLLAAGATMVAGGVILASNDNPEEYDIYGSNFETGSILMATGLVVDLISIPFFISSAKNASRAASISLTNQSVLSTAQNRLLRKTQPAVTVRITL